MFKRIFKFGLVGLSGVVIGLAIITLCVEAFKINPRTAWYVSTFFATLNNFFWHNYFTWKERKATGSKDLGKKMFFYYLFAAVSIFLNYFIYNFFLDYGFHYFISLGISIIICAVFNFIINELFVWPKRKINA